ncbi:hypothetical protein QWA68_014184 [Fusarium oxysporum]|nr:hypothetical protein QWA68_014184 [Fusarium oxysporum]
MPITARKIAREVIGQCTRRQARPRFCWRVANNNNELVVMHPEIDSWKSDMKEQYEEQKKRHPEYGRNALIIHALTRDYAIEGKILKHAIRVASWQPPNGIKGHLESLNETALAHPLGEMLDGRFYGLIVAFTYHLDPELNYNRMSTADFRHVVDIFQNSMWNPMIGDVDRYPDVHAARHQWPARRWVASYAKFLTGAVCLGYKCFSTAELNLADGMLIFHAFGAQISPLHLVAYDEFMYGLAKADKTELDCSKKEFLKLWNELQEGKTKILNEEQEHWDFDFANAASPYDGSTNTESVLTKETSKAFLHIRQIFQDPGVSKSDADRWIPLLFVTEKLRFKYEGDLWPDDMEDLFSDLATHISNGPKKDTRKKLPKEEFEQFMKLLRPYLEN